MSDPPALFIVGYGFISGSPGALIELYEMSPAGSRFDSRFREPVCSDKIDLQLHTSLIAIYTPRALSSQ